MSTDPVVATTAGRVRGFVDEAAAVFLGIPFAAPPFGPGRFGPPAPVAPWDGIRDATRHGPTAQDPLVEIPGGIPEPSIPGEDVLNLNVFTPDLGSARLPVLVWFHGGGYVAGCNASPWYRGTRFARDGVVVVSIGYRLGAEGFLELEGAASNRAVLDWIAALEWVQGEITSFGGDPSRVTVAGQSAGAGACTTLLAVPRARGLFAQVLAMSGVPRADDLDAARAVAASVAAHLGVRATRDDLAAIDPLRVLEAQRAAAPAGMDATRRNGGVRSTGMPFAPVVDGDVLPESPLRAIAGGAGADVPLLYGTTSEEFTAPIAVGAATIREDQLLRALANVGIVDPERYRSRHGSRPAPAVLGQAVTDVTFRIPAERLAAARAPAAAPTYRYEFRWPSGNGRGAIHCLDIPFAFDVLDAPDVAAATGDDPPQALADVLHRAWTAFVTGGDPGWPPHRATDRVVMLFDTESGPATDPLRADREVWPAS